MATAVDRQQVQQRAAEEEAVRPLLARANLLRMRRQWDEAVAVCTEALRLAPHSATAHSLLGDIYEAQDKLADALQWFGMAVDLDPGNAADRSKLERVLAQQRARYEAEEKTRRAAMPPVLTPAAPRPAGEKTLEWFDRVFPPGRSDSIARLILATGVGIALILCFCLAFVYYATRQTTVTPPPAAPLPVSENTAPVVMNPPVTAQAGVTMALDSDPSPVAVRPTPASTAVAARQAPAAPAAPSHDTAVETGVALRSKLTSVLSPSGITLSEATVVPSTGVLALDMKVTADPGDATAEKTRERVLRAALLAAQASVQAEPRFHRASIRVSAPAAGGTTTFTGDIALAGLHNVNAAGLSEPELTTRFSNVQWSPSLVADSAAGPSLPPAVSNNPASNTATR